MFFCSNVFVVIKDEFYDNYFIITIDVAVVSFVKAVVYVLVYFLILSLLLLCCCLLLFCYCSLSLLLSVVCRRCFVVVLLFLYDVLLCTPLLTFDRRSFVYVT